MSVQCYDCDILAIGTLGHGLDLIHNNKTKIEYENYSKTSAYVSSSLILKWNAFIRDVEQTLSSIDGK